MLAGIILAGATPGTIDPLAQASGVSKKSLIPVAGRPMVSRVYDALAGVERVKLIVVVGLSQIDCPTCSEKALFHPGFGDILDNALGSLELIRAHDSSIDYALIASSDIPMLTTRMVDAFVETCLTTRHEMYYSVVEQSIMDSAFPASGRSFRRFREHAYAGGDLHMVATRLDRANIERIRQATSSRKNALAQARLLGFGTLLKFALGRLTLDETVRAAHRALGLHGRVIISPDPEVAMDVDKPHQLAQVREILEARSP